MTDNLEPEIRFFERQHDELRKLYGKDAWIVVSGGAVQGHFKDFASAAQLVAEKFSQQPALVRQVDSAPVHVPYVLMRA